MLPTYSLNFNALQISGVVPGQAVVFSLQQGRNALCIATSQDSVHGKGVAKAQFT